MIEIEIPGYKTLKIVHLVLNYNGTLAFDGALIDGVKASLGELSQMLTVSCYHRRYIRQCQKSAGGYRLQSGPHTLGPSGYC